MNVTALIIGIDGWERYTKPLVDSIRRHEPDCWIQVVDNASATPYPAGDGYNVVRRDNRISYARAINWAHLFAPTTDWYIVLSNDVLCLGPFAHWLKDLDVAAVYGPQVWQEHGLSWVVGWCVCIPARVWDAVGGWDEHYRVSSWEDADFSVTAVERGYRLVKFVDFPFMHLDQKQRFTLPGYSGSEAHNAAYFWRKHAAVKA